MSQLTDETFEQLHDRLGASRRVWGTWLSAAALVQSFATGGTPVPQGYAGLSGFGEPVDVHIQRGSSSPPPPYTTVQRLQYGYDGRGNRTWAMVDQVNAVNVRSYAYGYDRLQRLVSADMGVLSLTGGSGGTGFQPVINPPSSRLGRNVDWALDHLGNWVGNAADSLGFTRIDTPPSGAPVQFTTDHTTDRGNQIEQIAYTSGVPPNPPTLAFVHDAAGNLVFDGRFVYLYDGFNRLVRVLRGEQLNPNPALYFEPATTGNPPMVNPVAGRPTAAANLNEADHLVADFAYDGFGRMISKHFFIGKQGTTRHFAESHYYYDGARRIQDVTTYDAATAAFLWPNAADRPLCVETGAGGVCTLYAVEHEYVYGPDYIDEPIALITPDDTYGSDANGDDDVYYFIQDANYNVMALTDAAGSVLVQYQYDPYGTVAIRDVPAGIPASSVPDIGIGHQGLFFERFYAENEVATATTILAAGPSGSSGGSNPPGGLYYTRNRWYSPIWARFTSTDPNGAGMPGLDSEARFGEPVAVGHAAVDLWTQYLDGNSLFEYVGSNPGRNRDPLGLEWGMEEELNDWLVDYAIDMQIASLQVEAAKQRSRDGMSLIRQYTAAAFAWGDFVWDQSEAALFGAVAGPFAATICFAPDTFVLMADGTARRIDEVCVGDLVRCGNAASARTSTSPSLLACAYVTATSCRTAVQTVEIFIEDGPIPLHCTPEHPFYSADREDFIPACRLRIGERLRTHLGETSVSGLREIEHPQVVYNLEVEGWHNYYVGSCAVLVHNACFRANAAENLRKLGLGAVDIAKRSFNAGRKMLEAAGFELLRTTKTGRKVFYNRETGGTVNFDGDHWHIVDPAGGSLSRRGRPVHRESGQAHIPGGP